MKRVLTAVVLIPLVLLVVFRAPLWLFALVVAGIIVLALHEYLNIAEAAGLKPFRRLTYAVAVLPTLLYCRLLLNISASPGAISNIFFSDVPLLSACSTLLFLSPIIFGIPAVFRKELKTGLAGVAASILGVAYVGISLSLLTALRASNYLLVVFVLFSVWAGDIAAYYVGRSIGRHKLAPIVSPKKTWEGAAASVIASVSIAFLVFHYMWQISELFRDHWVTQFLHFPLTANGAFFGVPWIHVILLGALTNIAAQFGDLFESALKRGAGVKDSGSLLPGHGGILDRIDALLFAIPVVWYYANLTGFLQPTLTP